jgi:hypothetical protein
MYVAITRCAEVQGPLGCTFWRWDRDYQEERCAHPCGNFRIDDNRSLFPPNCPMKDDPSITFERLEPWRST